MSVPIVNLRPLLEATEAAWRANLARMFEREFAAAMGAKYAVAVGTGTAAIELGLRGPETRRSSFGCGW